MNGHKWPTDERNADMDDLPHTEWVCEVCNAINSCLDGECQYCDGGQILEDEFERSK